MKPLYFILIGIVALALFNSEAGAQIQPWNTIIQINRFQVLNQFGNAAVFDKETGLVWELIRDNQLAIGTLVNVMFLGLTLCDHNEAKKKD
jgi:hypothetical protein